ncbi:probable LRR receptor-like serine/threonine-protein kinase At3g47570 [Rhodamnia argentea]|uniref:Probable LRR receptor-like serine/threonine-protein kinase At3g47570 n=1 Tax=Rhodamnia argentea TaxID=178133 RepID=A0ABM3HGA5_9MYRT|nr:probable LRR receptor-like serine/threonine-protein kinase At3g47570 [Rhodamnia argentea]
MKNGFIVWTGQAGTVATISRIVIDRDRELAALTQPGTFRESRIEDDDVTDLIKNDPGVADMPALEDAVDDEFGIVIASPQPFPGKWEEGDLADSGVYDLDEFTPDYKEIRQDFEQHETFRPLTGDETISINLGDEENPKEIKIGANLSPEMSRHSVPIEIMGLSSLAIFFSLAHNNLSGSLPWKIGSLINLGKLDLSYNRLSGLLPASISGCVRLEWLHLEANSFHGQIPQALHLLRGLQELDLSNNNFSGPIPSFLAELSLLNYLNISFNELEGQVPKGGVFLNASAVSISGNKQLCGGVPGLMLPLCKLPSSNKSSTTTAIVISVVAGSLLCLASLFLSVFCYRKKKQTRGDDTTSSSLEQQFLRISYEVLLRATDRFSETNLIGQGRYGTVYKGILDDGATVAVKVLNLMQRGASRSFVSECRTLGTIRHRNLVKILSVCSSVDFRGNDFKALIYEFMANESLEEWLHPGTIEQDDDCGKSRNLRLVQRLNVAIDIATAIEYMHKGCSLAIVHGDLKPSNVLLDNDMVARVGDFGLAKIIATMSTEATGVQDQGSSTSTAVRGSIGYVPPEYGMGHKVSTLGDAYSYGILLLEMFTGKRPTEEAFGHHLNLHSFVQMALPDRMMDIVDLRLWKEAGDRQQEIKMRDCIISVFEVGVACSMESPPDRMDMTEAIRKLCSIKASYETRERMTGM